LGRKEEEGLEKTDLSSPSVSDPRRGMGAEEKQHFSLVKILGRTRRERNARSGRKELAGRGGVTTADRGPWGERFLLGKQ